MGIPYRATGSGRSRRMIWRAEEVQGDLICHKERGRHNKGDVLFSKGRPGLAGGCSLPVMTGPGIQTNFVPVASVLGAWQLAQILARESERLRTQELAIGA